MTVELKPEQERILEEALRQGRYRTIEEALEDAISTIADRSAAKRPLSPGERAAAFRKWAESHPHSTPVLSDEAVSRKSIYSSRG